MGTITIYIKLKLGVNIKYNTQILFRVIFIETRKSEAPLDLALKKIIKISLTNYIT